LAPRANEWLALQHRPALQQFVDEQFASAQADQIIDIDVDSETGGALVNRVWAIGDRLYIQESRYTGPVDRGINSDPIRTLDSSDQANLFRRFLKEFRTLSERDQPEPVSFDAAYSMLIVGPSGAPLFSAPISPVMFEDSWHIFFAADSIDRLSDEERYYAESLMESLPYKSAVDPSSWAMFEWTRCFTLWSLFATESDAQPQGD